MRPRVSVLVLATAALCWSGPSPAQTTPEDCDPAVERDLERGAERGANREVRVVRDPEFGIRDPESLFDLSCLERMFDYGHANILFDPGRAMSDILGLLRRTVCRAAQDAYRGYVGRTLHVGAFARDLPRLPGLDVDRERENLLEDMERERERARERERQGRSDPWYQAPAAPARTGAQPTGNPERQGTTTRQLFRSLIGGDEEREEGR